MNGVYVMKIFLVRHGQDEPGYRGGWSDLPLTRVGEKEVEKLVEFLKIKQKEYNIQRIISSDLKRARMTTEIIARKINVEVEYTKYLREINNGKLSGMSNKEASEKYPGLYYNTLDIDERYPGGESPQEFYTRIINYFNSLLKENKNFDSIMLVTHGGVINAIYSYVTNTNWSNKFSNIKVESSSLFQIDIDKENNKVKQIKIG